MRLNISNLIAYLFLIFGTFVMLGIGISAYGTNNPSSLGHSFSEVQAPSPCTSGRFLQYDSSGWKCKSYSPYLGFLNLDNSGPIQDFLLGYIGTWQLEPRNAFGAVVTSKSNGNVGFFGPDTKAFTPREILDVQGNVRVDGDICSDVQGCLSSAPDLQLQYAGEYSATQGNPQNMPHTFCYLSSMQQLSGLNSYYCTITKNGGSWTLSTSITTEGKCKAICIDVS